MMVDSQSQIGVIESEFKNSKEKLETQHQHCVSGYKEYKAFLDDMQEYKCLYIFYVAAKSPNSGYSWCPTSVDASKVLKKYIADLPNSVFLTVEVGSQEEWEDKRNPFRTDKDLKLRVLPTILKYRTPMRLEGQYCLKQELLKILFDDECD